MADVGSPRVEDHEEAPGPSLNEQVADLPASTPTTGPATARSKTLLRIGLEVLLISAGVFLGLMGEQWREHAQHRELADASLGRLRAEILANRTAVASVKDYHVTTKATWNGIFAADPKGRKTVECRSAE